MSGLVLKLSPLERFLINGAVIENGERRARISIVTPHASILRLKDAIQPNSANTPVKRLCYLVQLTLSGDASHDQVEGEVLSGIEALSKILRDPESHFQLGLALKNLKSGNFYTALKALRCLLPTEEKLLAGVIK